MKILYYALVELEVPGGPTVHTLNVLKGFKEIGIQALLVCPKPGGKIVEEIPALTRYIRFFGFSPFRLFVFTVLSFFVVILEISRFRPDCLYVREVEGSLAIALAGWIFRTPVFMDVNGPSFMDYISLGKETEIGLRKRIGIERAWILFWRNIERKLQFALVRGLTFNTSSWRDQLCGEFHYPVERTRIITMYVDTLRFKPMKKEECRSRLGLGMDKLLLGYVGSFQPTHDMDMLFQCLEWLIREGVDAELLLVGGGNQMEHYRSRIMPQSLSKRVHFTGWVSPDLVPLYINACDVGSVVSKSIKAYAGESLLKTKEFMACGVPVIVNRAPELFAAYPKQGIGFVDNLNIAAAGREILGLSRIPRPEGMNQVTQFIRDQFALKECAKETVSFFQSVTKKKSL